jgi:hypothetical protein
MAEMRLPSVLCKGPNGELDPTSADATVGIETYFFDPFETAGSGEDAQATVAKKLEALRAFAGRNDKTVGELWLGFLRYFGLEFDASRQVVSVRMARALSKEEKKRAHQWRMHTRLSIEDPFEASYDVAHVLKGSRDKYIRQQFVRAYSLVMHQVVQSDAGADETAALEGEGDAAWHDAERVIPAPARPRRGPPARQWTPRRRELTADGPWRRAAPRRVTALANIHCMDAWMLVR